MLLSKRAIGKRFGLLATLVAALVIACAGVVAAQGSTANAGYEKADPDTTPPDAPRASASSVGNGALAAGDISVAARVQNGGFEAGDFRGWNGANQFGGSGDWFVYRRNSSPLSNNEIAVPPQGTFAATTDQELPGSHVLYRNIRLRSGMEHELSFYLYYKNLNNRFFTPNTLKYTTNGPNQQYRVDVLRATANPFTVQEGQILARLFRTNVGDRNRLAPTLMTFNLTRFAGKVVRLRFAEVDNQSNLLASVDNVKVKSTSR